MLATSTATWLIVVFTGIAAVATTGYLVVTARAHLHDRAVSGTRRPVIARRPRSSYKPDFPLPSQFSPARTVAVAVHLRNRSATPESVTLEKVHVLWPLRQHFEFNPVNSPVTVRASEAMAILITARGDWKHSRKHVWLRLVFESSGRERFAILARFRVFQYEAAWKWS